MAIASFTAGGRKLPGGRAAVLVTGLLLAACAAPATSVPPSSPQITSAPARTAPVTESPAAIPTLGTKPPTGLVFPTYFISVTASSNGSIAVLTAPASACGLTVRAPSGASIDAGRRVADASGVASWTYAPIVEHGESILTVGCSLGDQTQTTKAQVLVP